MVPQRLRDCVVHEDASIRNAMEALNRGAAEIALVVNVGEVLVGTCTDGDVRRALLSGSSLESRVSPHIKRDFVWVGPEAGRAEVLDLMRARHIQQVPIVNQQGKLLGLHLMRELIGAVQRSNWAVLMAGGKGTRLNPLTENVPKPMIPVAGRPILERLVMHLTGYGIRRIFLSINHLGHIIEDHFGDGAQYGCTIEYLREDHPLGTAGSLSLLPEPPEDPLIVMNGDLITGLDIARMLAFHTTGGYMASIGVREYCHTIPFGAVEIDGDQIRAVNEKPTYSWFVNTGTYVLNPELLVCVSKDKECPITSLLGDALERGDRIGAYKVGEDWIDVGRISDLARALGKEDQV